MADMDDENPYASPQPDSQRALRELQIGSGPWRDGDVLVMLKEEALPPRCVQCNEPTAFVLKQTLNWLRPFTYLFLPTGLGFLVAALILGHAAEVHVGLCEVHRLRRRIARVVQWALWLSAIGLFAVGATAEHRLFHALGLLLVPVALVYGMFGARIVRPQRIDREFAWLKGVCPQYLAGLPRWVASDRQR